MENETVTVNNAVVDGVVAGDMAVPVIINVKVNESDNKTNENDESVNKSDEKLLPIMDETVTVIVDVVENEGLERENATKSEEQINMQRYMEQLELASYFPSLHERCLEMAKLGQKPEVGINTGALRGEVIQQAGMDLLTAIKKEVFDAKPEWEKEWIKEGRISGAKLDDDFYGEVDDVTPQDGRPKLTVEYLRSIGYDIDIN